MSVDDRTSLAEEVLSGENREIQMLVARGLLPLPPQDLVPLQVALAEGCDEEVAAIARQSLADLDPRILANVVAEGTASEVVRYFALEAPHPLVLETILRQRGVSSELLGQVAPRLSPDLQEVLLLRQDLLVEDPSILDQLESNPQLTSYARRRIGEYREHLLPREPAAPAVQRVVPEVLEEPTDEEVEEAIEQARLEPAEGEVDELTGLSEAQIRTLPVPVRLKLTRGAPRTLRAILVRDKNPQVARSVLSGNALGDSEVEQIASSRAVVEEVLDAIARARQWIRKYPIMHALVRNPRTPVGLAVRLAPRLGVRDLRNLMRDRNVAEAVRSAARRLYKIKQV